MVSRSLFILAASTVAASVALSAGASWGVGALTAVPTSSQLAITSAGAPGATGSTGSTGSQGASGIAGLNGVDGVKGATGSNGATGLVGAIGSDGLQGLTGAVGATGDQGIAGADGLRGLIGEVGPAGPAGDVGRAGPVGATGATGASAPTFSLTRPIGMFLPGPGSWQTDESTGLVPAGAALVGFTIQVTDFSIPASVICSVTNTDNSDMLASAPAVSGSGPLQTVSFSQLIVLAAPTRLAVSCTEQRGNFFLIDYQNLSLYAISFAR